MTEPDDHPSHPILARRSRTDLLGLGPEDFSRRVAAAMEARRAGLLLLGKGYWMRISSSDGYCSEPQERVIVLHNRGLYQHAIANAGHDSLPTAICRAILRAVRWAKENL